MLSIQDSFYGICGLLAALALTHPKFYVKYSLYIVAAAVLNLVLILAITMAILMAADNIVDHKNEFYDFARVFADFVLKTNQLEILSYMLMLIIVWGNMHLLSLMIDKSHKENKK
ncbi:hypothetical protein NRZ30_02405 [Aeromonas jandaei]|uniref:hypothetical protein n=1 Tax=Aeromonas jandaei TaxID=650 RepID=UPI00227C6249|nr:hypothetical protein [Aeromonas jandaei]WAG07935.1 hypothetical protein NRZ30_02405 [Aeromonas jandaei]